MVNYVVSSLCCNALQLLASPAPKWLQISLKSPRVGAILMEHTSPHFLPSFKLTGHRFCQNSFF